MLAKLRPSAHCLALAREQPRRDRKTQAAGTTCFARALRHVQRASPVLVVFAVMMGAPLSNCTASPSVSLQVTLGFSNTFRPAHWTPLTVTLGNHGHDVSGYLEVRTRDGDEFRDNVFDITHRRRIDLTRDSRKRVHFTVRMPNVAHPLVIRFVADGKELAAKHIDLRTHFTTNRLLVVVSRDANLDYLNDKTGHGIRVLYPHPELLPDHWQGYDAVEALVLHGVSLEELSTRQYDALRKWIAQGGTLAVSGGADYAWLRTPRMIELLPTTPIGMIAITDAASVRNVFGRPLEISAPFHVNQLAASNARISVHAAQVPLVAESRLGRGRVLYLTFDVARSPFDRWPGMQQTWFDLLRINNAPAQAPFIEAIASPVTALVDRQSSNFPGHGTLLLFVALYLSVLVTAYRLSATGGVMRSLLALASWGAPLLFAPVAYFLFGPVLFDRGESITVVSVIEPLGNSPYAHVQSDIGIHSNRDSDDHGSMQLFFAGLEPTLHPPAVATKIDPRANPPASWTFNEGTPRAITPGDARRYALHLLEGEDVIDFDLQAVIDLAPSEPGRGNDVVPRITIHNKSGRTLVDAWLIAGDRAWFVGSVAAQGSTPFRVETKGFELNSRNAEWWDRLERHPKATAENVLLLKTLLARKDSTTFDATHSAYPGLGTALLIASTTHPLLPSGSSARWQHTARTLVLLPISAALLVKDESSVTDL